MVVVSLTPDTSLFNFARNRSIDARNRRFPVEKPSFLFSFSRVHGGLDRLGERQKSVYARRTGELTAIMTTTGWGTRFTKRRMVGCRGEEATVEKASAHDAAKKGRKRGKHRRDKGND